MHRALAARSSTLRWRFLALLAGLCCVAAPAAALDRVKFKYKDRATDLEGRILVTAQDGGLMLQTRDGTIWPIQPDEILSKTADSAPFAPYTPDELSARMLRDLGEGFGTHRTLHYVICYNTSPEYAKWCGALFEQLYKAFTNYWSQRGFLIHEPDFPLVAVVFNDRASYLRFAEAEVGESARSIIGYFSLQTNRMIMYDLTGMESLSHGRARRGTLAEINQILSQPDAERTVATIVHEATHQIAYNCGLHTRYSDCPLWFAEGIAIYFETPDLGSAKGWRNVGAVNRPRIVQFRQYLRKRPADSLETLLRDDKRLRDPQQAIDAYAEAWTLTYFLIRQKPKQYVQYLQNLSAKPVMVWDTPQQRIEEFTKAFGDLRKLDVEFLRFVSKMP